MAFMRAAIEADPELVIISDEMEEPIYMDYSGYNLPEGEYDGDNPEMYGEFADMVATVCKELEISNFTVALKYCGRLQASGYMDQTSSFFGDTQADVAQQLLDTFFDWPVEDMDEDEIADRAWLESIIEEEKEAA